MYNAKGSAVSGIESVRVNSQLDERCERLSDVVGKPYFVLRAANGEVIGKSESYASAADMEIGIASVKAEGADAEIEDLTTVR